MKIHKKIILSLIVGLLLAAAVSVLDDSETFWNGLLSASILLIPAGFVLISAWEWAGSPPVLTWILTISFIMHLFLGIAFSLALPTFGYDNEYQSIGYPFKDSYYRDQAAWQLAQSEEPLWHAFSDEFFEDQYGGLSFLSAAVYRYLSPDLHRPFLILILTSFCFTIGIPFFWIAIKNRWNENLANLATWILALYPEGIFYSISQMREPFLIGGGAIAYWAVINWRNNRRISTIVFIACILFLGLISWTVTLAIAGAMMVLFLLEYATPLQTFFRRIPKWVYVAIAIFGLFAIIGVGKWFSTSTYWDYVMAERDSERTTIEISNIGEQFRIPFIVVKGVTQVVLPAAIAQPSIALWRAITILRSAGWYLLVPFLFFAVVNIWHVKERRERRVFLWLTLFTIIWVFTSSARAGGDLWDNPRYRTIFIPWMAFLAAWVWQSVRERKDPWLGRILIVEAIFLAFFTEWYLARYTFESFIRLKFWTMVGWILGLSALVVAGGIIMDMRKRAKSVTNDQHSSIESNLAE